MGIRTKLVIIFFAGIIVPMLLLWARWQGTAIGSIKSVIRQDLADRAREISDQVSRSLEFHKGRVIELTNQPALRAYARVAARSNQIAPDQSLRLDLSAFLLSHQDQYAALVGINRQGAPLFKIGIRTFAGGINKPSFVDQDFSSEDIVRAPETISESVFVSDFQVDAEGPHLKLIAPLKDDSGAATAAIVIKVRAGALLAEAAGPRAMPKPNQPATSRPQTAIISPQGTVLYTTDGSKELWEPYPKVYREFERSINELRQEADKDLDRDPWLIRHHLRAASPQFSVYQFENYRNNAVGDLEFNSYVLLFMTLLLVVVPMLILYQLISRITDSIRHVTRGAKAVATGNLGYQIKVNTRDETRVLGEAFNRMAGRLREMIRKEGEQKQFESFARLSAVLTHDLKNQILSLSLLVNNMERKFDREGFKEDAMRTLSDSVNNLQSLVAKLSDPRTPTKRARERSNISHLVERVIQRTAAQAPNKFKVSAELAPDIFATVDGKAVERVIENLVINALEAMPDGGALRVQSQQENGNAIIAIADTGKGMTEEFKRDRLFHPFATTKKKGIGLGLYSCRDIIEQHGGRIDVKSEVNAGTEFKIVLPLKTEETPSGRLRPIITV
ncbi:MAG: sensor histidine kinase [Blastocatellia bacterium]